MSELSLREELDVAIEDASNEAIETAPVDTAPVEAAPVEKAEKTRDEQGKFAAKSAEESTVIEKPAVTEQIKPETGQEVAALYLKQHAKRSPSASRTTPGASSNTPKQPRAIRT